MKRLLALCALIAVSAVVTGAVEPGPKSLDLTLTTHSTAPMFALPPGMPPGMTIPGLTDMNKPTRSIDGSAEYRRVPAGSIHVSVPGDLGLAGDRLVLRLSRPEAVSIPDSIPSGRGPAPSGRFQMTTKQYWRPNTAAGPLVNEIDVDLSQYSGADGRMPSRRTMERAMERAGIDRTATGEEDVPNVGPGVGRGAYVLNTGSVTVPIEGFLAAVNVSEPASIMSIDPVAGFELVWQSDPLARGYILHATGMVMEGQSVKEIIKWVSTESTPPERVRDGYEPATTIAADVAAKILLPPGTSRCRVPSGVFTERVNMVTIKVTAVGPDFRTTVDSTLVTVKIRSEWDANWNRMMAEQMNGAGGYGGRGGRPGSGSTGSGRNPYLPPGYEMPDEEY